MEENTIEPTPRAKALQQAKDRALDFPRAEDMLASFMSDCRSRPELKDVNEVAMDTAALALMYAMNNDTEGMATWIKGFN